MSLTMGTVFDRDALERWYAKRHFEIDPGVVQIHYLPTDAPSREVRFLEVNTMIAEAPPEPIDFGVDIGGAEGHTLHVLDVTPAQWEAIRSQEMSLSLEWTLHLGEVLGDR